MRSSPATSMAGRQELLPCVAMDWRGSSSICTLAAGHVLKGEKVEEYVMHIIIVQILIEIEI